MSGKDAVVLGRSNIVGMPMSQLLLAMNATVTVCHSRTANIKAKCAAADIVIAAIGRAEMVRGDWIKPGAVVIDVGINSVDDATKKRGYRLTGDVCFEEAKAHAGAITPVRMLHRHHRAAAHPFIRLSRLTPYLPPETPPTHTPLCTQVPGGVGPMTIAMLLKNTVNLARHSLSLPAL